MKKITKIQPNETLEVISKTRVAAYCRVSTANEDQLISLETQKAHYENYIAARDDWELVNIYYDEGISGTKITHRNGLKQMINDCRKGMIDLIITKSISRFARNTTDCLQMVRELMELGVAIYFEKENINTQSMESEFMLSVLSSLAESESSSISQNSKWSISKKFQDGTYIISYPPYGYQNVNGEMVIIPEQAEVVKRIFAECLAGEGSYRIAKRLNEEGVPSKKGGNWHSTTIREILKNEKYTGDVIYQKTYTDDSFNRHRNKGEKNQYLVQNHHEPIISHEDFELAGEIMERRAIEKGNGTDTSRYLNRYAMSGKIKCGECGATFKRRKHYKPSGDYVAWSCNTHIKDKESCSMLYIEDEPLKNAFVTMMNKLQFGHKAILLKLYDQIRLSSRKDVYLRLDAIETELSNVQEQKESIEVLMTKGILDPGFTQMEIARVNKEIENLKDEFESLTQYIGRDTTKIAELEKLIKICSRKEPFTTFNDDQFSQTVDKVIVLNRDEVEFHLKCGLHLKERLVRL